MSLLDEGDSTARHRNTVERKSKLAKLLPFTTIAMVLAALYVAWTFYSRIQSAKQAQAAAEKKQEDARKKSADMIFGSGEVKFLVFSAGDGHLQRGQSTQLCYGLVNATTVTIEPDIGEEVKPTARHCVDISPKQTTTYTITASNEKGQSKSTSLTVHVN